MERKADMLEQRGKNGEAIAKVRHQWWAVQCSLGVTRNDKATVVDDVHADSCRYVY